MTQPDPNELSDQMRNAMMVFVAKFLFVILPPLIGIFFYILTMTKNDVQITVGNEITKIEQTHQSNIAHMKALNEREKQTYKNKIAETEQVHQSKIAEMDKQEDRREQAHQNKIKEMNTSRVKIEQTHQSKITELEKLKDKIEQTHKSNVAEMDKIKQTHKSKIAEIERLKDKMKTCRENCDKKNLELKILEKQDRFKMNFNVDKEKVEFKFEEVK